MKLCIVTDDGLEEDVVDRLEDYDLSKVMAQQALITEIRDTLVVLAAREQS